MNTTNDRGAPLRDSQQHVRRGVTTMVRATQFFRTNNRRQRRGVASVLAMMFLVIFASLCAVMAVVAQGNLRTADSYLKVSRATGAAETGLIFAKRRLAESARRFVVTKGVVTDDFGTKLWLGTYGPSDGTVEVLPPDGFSESSTPAGLAEAIRNAHLADEHTIEVDTGDALLPDIDEFGTLRVRPIALYEVENTPYFRLKYELLADGRFVRVTSQGVDGDVHRTLQMDFRITKKIEFAVISPNRVMIGKNVRIEGPLGTRYGIVPEELAAANGHPLVMRSDFRHLDDALTAEIDTFMSRVAEFDVDGDGRLRPNHPIEAQGLNGFDFEDTDGDEYVDDFDLFMAFYDANDDEMICYDADKAQAAGNGTLSEEFAGIDDQLALLIDRATPDRNGDGVINATDTALGYDDGVIDARDQYAKVAGRLAFAVERSAWEDAQGGTSYQSFVQGPIRPELEQPPVTFDVSEDELLDISTADFLNTSNWMKNAALAGQSFDSQVASNLGGNPNAEYTAPTDNDWETVPYGAKGYYDWYRRPVYKGMVFENVVIPAGNNGLFVECTFIGSTYVRVHTENIDVNWNYVGMVDRNPATGNFESKFPGLTADVNGNPVTDTRLYSNNIRMHDCEVYGSIVTDTPEQYTHVRNKIQFTGSTIFSLEHPNLDDEEIEELSKSSVLAPGYSIDVGNFTNEANQKVELKGTIIAGILDARGSVDVHGTLLMTFRPVEGEGPLYYGGSPDGFNTTIGYFGPSDGDAESVDPSTLTDTDGDGIPDIGMDLDGDGINDPFMGFGEITLRYDPEAKLPDGIPWPIRIEAEKGTYTEGGSM